MTDVTRLLSQIDKGDPNAADQLLPLVYDKLHQLAAARLINEKPGQTLQATALVHEAYVRLVDVDKAEQWNGRGHFFAAAAEAMRRILTESARRKNTLKRGGNFIRTEIDPDELPYTPPSLNLLDLDAALDELARVDSESAELVKLRYFAGLTIQEAASALGISTATADRHWAYARAWLQAELSDDQPDTRK